MENYKGLYYNDSKEQKYFEGGAHFKYQSLFKVLLSLGGKLKEEEYYNKPALTQNYREEKIQIDKDINYLLKKVEGKKSKFKTRNLAQFNYVNNPNTKVKLNTRILSNKDHLSIKNENNFHSRNVNTNQLLERNNNSYFNKTTTSVINNNIKNNINSNLINYLLYKKEIAKKNEEKNNDTINPVINNNDNNNSNGKHSISHCYKYIHNRNRSDAFINFNNNVISSISKINSSKNIENDNKSNVINYHKKIMINRSNKNNNIMKNNNYEKNDNYYIKISNNKFSLENKKQEVNENNENEKGEKTNINKSRNNGPILYYNSKYSNLKERLKSELSYDKNIKRSRNIINKNIISYNTCEINNNNTNINYRKKYINNYIPRIENKSKIENDIYNFSDNLNNINNNNFIRTINNTSNNNNLYTNGSYENKISKTLNAKNKIKILKPNGNNFIIQKYIKKKINQLCVFNQNNCKIKGGKVNLSNKKNELSGIKNKFKIQ